MQIKRANRKNSSADQYDDEVNSTGGRTLLQASNTNCYEMLQQDDIPANALINVSAPPSMLDTIPYNDLKGAYLDYPSISLEEAVDVILKKLLFCSFLRSCYGKYQVIEDNLTYDYRIDVDCFYEKRSVSWVYETENGILPDPCSVPLCEPWEVPFNNATPFELFKQDLILPGSKSKGICTKCNQNSVENNNMAMSEDPNVKEKLISSPSADCPYCHGTGSINRFIKVTDEYQIKSFSKYLKSTNLPDSYTTKAKGVLAFSKQGTKFVNSCSFLDENLNVEIGNILQEIDAWEKQSGCITHNQEIFVSIIPVRSIVISFRGKTYSFIVYDPDLKVCHL